MTTLGCTLSDTKGILAAEKQGRAGVHNERIAARKVVALGDAVPAREVVVCTLAMFVVGDGAAQVSIGRRLPNTRGACATAH